MAEYGKRIRLNTTMGSWYPTLGQYSQEITGVEFLIIAGGGGVGGLGDYQGYRYPSGNGAGTANTGGGGGTDGGTAAAHQPGGSGIIILRYSNAYTCNFGAGLTGVEASVANNKKTATITAGSGTVTFS